MTVETTPIVYTLPDAVKASGFSRTRLYHLMGNGSIAAVKVGRRTLIRAESLHGYIDTLPAAKVRAPAKTA